MPDSRFAFSEKLKADPEYRRPNDFRHKYVQIVPTTVIEEGFEYQDDYPCPEKCRRRFDNPVPISGLFLIVREGKFKILAPPITYEAFQKIMGEQTDIG